MTSSALRFLLIDDHALFRTGLSLMLAERWPHAACQHAGTWAEVQRLLADEAQPAPDVVLLDVHLPDGRAVGHLPELIARWPHSPVLLMSGQVNEADVDAARAHGAAGFLSKTASAHEIVAAVQRACEGSGAVFDAWTSPFTAPHVSGQTLSVAEVRPSYGDDGSLQLDARQRDILRYLGRNTPNKAIARQLGLSEDQVRVTVSWLTEALNASSRLQAYETALARGLLRS